MTSKDPAISADGAGGPTHSRVDPLGHQLPRQQQHLQNHPYLHDRHPKGPVSPAAVATTVVSPRTWCRLRSLVFAIGIVFLSVQIGLLVLNLILLLDSSTHIGSFLDWFVDHGVQLSSSSSNPSWSLPGTNSSLSQPDRFGRQYIVKKSRDYLAIPVTINVVLIMANALLIWATAARNKLLLWPWMVLYAIEFVFLIAVLVLLMVVIPEPWLKVVIFLIGSPIIILLGFFWFVVKSFYSFLRDLGLKEALAAVYHHHHDKGHLEGPQSPGGHGIGPAFPSTVYSTTDPNQWDRPLPLWSSGAPPGAAQPIPAPPSLVSARRPGWSLGHRCPEGPIRRPRVQAEHRPAGPSVPAVLMVEEEEQDLQGQVEGAGDGGDTYKSSSCSDGNRYLRPRTKDPPHPHHGEPRAVSKGDPERGVAPADPVPYENLPRGGSSSVRSFSHRYTANGDGGLAATMSDDRCSSIVSLSDKFRTQEEIEVSQEHYRYCPPPEPIRPDSGTSDQYRRTTTSNFDKSQQVLTAGSTATGLS